MNGQGGTDRISLLGGGSHDFTQVTLTSIEQLSLTGSVTLNGGQIGAGAITSVTAVGGGAHALIVVGASANLGAVTFTGWTAADTITINCNSGAGGVLVGSNQIDIIHGGNGVDTLDGGAGDDTLDGGGAADTMKGGAGSDTYIVGSGDIVDESGGDGTDTVVASVNFSLGDTVHVKGAVENLTLFGAALQATGNGLANTLVGNANANTLDGGGGGDTMRGLGGSDTYVVRSANDVVDESAAGSGGTDKVLAHLDFSLAATLGAVENLTLTGATALKATGNDLANTITGNGNGNILDGRGGADTLRGLGGNDTYVVDNTGDVADESAAGSGGTDTILASVNIDLGGGAADPIGLAPAATGLGAIENVTLTGNAIEATGNDLANTITGNARDNALDGGEGADLLFGAAGDDRLIGGRGPDTITGGSGINSFVFLTLGDSGKKAAARDTIADFSAEDFIDLAAIDARKGGRDNSFKFIGKHGFHDKKGELHYQKKGADLMVSGDVNGDGKADFSVLVTDLKKLAASDFVL